MQQQGSMSSTGAPPPASSSSSSSAAAAAATPAPQGDEGGAPPVSAAAQQQQGREEEEAPAASAVGGGGGASGARNRGNSSIDSQPMVRQVGFNAPSKNAAKLTQDQEARGPEYERDARADAEADAELAERPKAPIPAPVIVPPATKPFDSTKVAAPQVEASVAPTFASASVPAPAATKGGEKQFSVQASTHAAAVLEDAVGNNVANKQDVGLSAAHGETPVRPAIDAQEKPTSAMKATIDPVKSSAAETPAAHHNIYSNYVYPNSFFPQGSSYNSTVEDSLASMMSMSSDNQERPLVAAASDAEGMGAMHSVPQAVLDQEQNLGTSVASARTSTISDVREGSTSTPLSAVSVPQTSPTRRVTTSQAADAGAVDLTGGKEGQPSATAAETASASSGAKEGGSPRAAGDPKQKAQQKQEYAFEKKPKLSKAERRAIQEEQRRLKAAGMKGAAKGGSSNARAAASGAGSGDAPAEVQRRGSLKSPTSGGGGAATVGTSANAGSGAGGGSAAPGGGGKQRERNAKTTLQFDDKNAVARLAKRSVVPLARQCQISFFRHLPEYEASALDSFVKTTSLESDSSGGDVGSAALPTVILKLGLMYGKGAITGGSRRCVAMLNAFKIVLQDYETPAGKMLVRDFTSHLGKHIQFLQDCRPMSMSMKNAIRWLKSTINKMATNVANGYSQTDEEAREELLELIDRYIQEKIVFAGKVAARKAATKISEGDCVLVYQPCPVVLRALEIAHTGTDNDDDTPGYVDGGAGVGLVNSGSGKTGRNFRIVVVESSPSKAAIEFVRRFLRKGIQCTLVTINGIGNVMKEVSKVILSASAVHANGTVLARAGTSMISMMARNNNKPVMIVCESCKFSELVQVDSFTYNEIGNPDGMIASGGGSAGSKGGVVGDGAVSSNSGARGGGKRSVLEGYQNSNLSVLNLVYDVTPSEFVTLIVTEFGLVPPTSVPVILRESRNDIGVGI